MNRLKCNKEKHINFSIENIFISRTEYIYQIECLVMETKQYIKWQNMGYNYHYFSESNLIELTKQNQKKKQKMNDQLRQQHTYFSLVTHTHTFIYMHTYIHKSIKISISQYSINIVHFIPPIL